MPRRGPDRGQPRAWGYRAARDGHGMAGHGQHLGARASGASVATGPAGAMPCAARRGQPGHGQRAARAGGQPLRAWRPMRGANAESEIEAGRASPSATGQRWHGQHLGGNPCQRAARASGQPLGAGAWQAGRKPQPESSRQIGPAWRASGPAGSGGTGQGAGQIGPGSGPPMSGTSGILRTD